MQVTVTVTLSTNVDIGDTPTDVIRKYVESGDGLVWLLDVDDDIEIDAVDIDVSG